jgi:hypothetical protein
MALHAAIVKALHEGGHVLAVAALVHLLWRRQPSCLEDPRATDGLAAIFGTVTRGEIDGSIRLLVGNTPSPRHSAIRPDGAKARQVIAPSPIRLQVARFPKNQEGAGRLRSGGEAHSPREDVGLHRYLAGTA